MITSFSTVSAPCSEKMHMLSEKMRGDARVIVLGDWAFMFTSDAGFDLDRATFEDGESTCYLVGAIENTAELREMAATCSAHAWDCNESQLIRLLLASFGPSVFSLIDGAYSYIRVLKTARWK